MKQHLCVVLITVLLATPSFAAKVYLKDGGVIQAKQVWRSDGKVYVLATRDTMTSFETSEIDLRRTFVKKHKVTKRIIAVTPKAQTKAPTDGAAESKMPVDKKAGISHPSLSILPEKSPESIVPSSGTGGTIRQQKKEMAEKLGE